MQNLFLKSLVLIGVIGGSCYVVWQAHESLQNVETSTDPSQFQSLPGSEEKAPDAEPGVDSLGTIDLGGVGPISDEVESQDDDAILPTIAKPRSPEEIAKPLSAEEVDSVSRRSLAASTSSAPVLPELAEPEREDQYTSNAGPSKFPPLGELSNDGDETSTGKTEIARPLAFFPANGGADIPTVELTKATETPESSQPEVATADNLAPIPDLNSLPQLENLSIPEADPPQPKAETTAISTSVTSLSAPAEPNESTAPVMPTNLAGTRFGPSAAIPTLPDTTPTLPEQQPEQEPLAVAAASAPSGELRRLPSPELSPVLLPPAAFPAADRSTEQPTNEFNAVVTAAASETEGNRVTPAAGEEANPFARFQNVAAENSPVLPEPAPLGDNPFATIARPGASSPAEVSPVEPAAAGFTEPSAVSRIPEVAENPFPSPVLPAAKLPATSSDTFSTNQPIPTDLLPPMENDPPKPELSSAPDLSPVPTAGVFPATSNPSELSPTPVLPEPEPLDLQPVIGNAIPEERSFPAASEPVLPNEIPAARTDLPEVRPALGNSNPFPDLAAPEPTPVGRPLTNSANELPQITPAIPPRSRFNNDSPPSGSVPVPKPFNPFAGQTAPAPIPDSLPPNQPVANELPSSRSIVPLGFNDEPQPTPAAEVNPFASNPNPPIGTTPTEPGNLLTGESLPEATIPSDSQSPELKIEKIAPPQASIGESLIYAIRIKNVGGSKARSVVVEDRVPRGTQLVGTIPQAEASGDKLVWALGDMNPGDEKTIKLKVIPQQAGDIGSVATVSFESAVSATIRVTAPQLSVDIDGPMEAILGKNIPYKFTVRNTGQGDAKDVVLRAILPPALRHSNGNDIEAELGNIPAGKSRTIELVVQAGEVGVATPKILIWMDGKTQAQNQADVRIIESRLSISRSGPQRRFVGRPAQYTTQVTNDSSSVLNNVTVIEELPAAVDLTSFVSGWDPNRREIRRTIPALQPGETREFVTEVVPNQAGEIRGKVIAADQAGNQAEVVTNLAVKGFADLYVDVSGQNKVVAVGDQLSLRLSLKNDGTAPATDVQAAFEIPQGLQFATASGPSGYQVVGNTVYFEAVDEVPTNAEKAYDIVLTAAEAGSKKVRVALQSSDDPEPFHLEEPVRVIADE